MNETTPTALTPRALLALQARRAREAAALRQNLRRRKARSQEMEPVTAEAPAVIADPKSNG